MSLPRADSAAYDSGREDALLSCFEGTRVSILAEIMSWFESTENGTPPIYWLVGLAGIGKSTIAKTVAERADKRPEKDRMLGGSFFFSRSDAPLRNPNLVFSTLAFQLAQADNEFKNIIGEAVQQDATLGHKEPLAQFEGLILKPLNELNSHRRTTLIVLDALDECEERGAATILQLLLAHVSRLPFLRILITSRPEPHISLVFSEARNLAKRILHDIEASVIEEDLRLYIRSELREIPKKLGLRSIGDWTDGEIDALVEKSGKLFIYAATSIRFIGDTRVRDPRGHLRLILDTQLRKESEATPYSQLDSLYVGVLRNSLSDSNRKAIVKRFQTVVGSIVLLREPLPLGSLAQFVQLTLVDVDTALRHLRSVIIPPSIPDEAPRIYHPSFRDFITDPSRCSIPEFVIVAVPDQELRHALRCFELMATFLRQDIAGISDVSLLNSEVEGLEEKVREALPAEVQYACRYWASHLSRVELGEERMVEALERFSMRSILMWFEAMSLIGSVYSAVTPMEVPCRWAVSAPTIGRQISN
jgi:AAA ATPase domain